MIFGSWLAKWSVFSWAPMGPILCATSDARSCVLPPGAQQFEGSLMHQAVVAQRPEGKLRAWAEEHYSQWQY